MSTSTYYMVISRYMQYEYHVIVICYSKYSNNTDTICRKMAAHCHIPTTYCNYNYMWVFTTYIFLTTMRERNNTYKLQVLDSMITTVITTDFRYVGTLLLRLKKP